MLATITDEGTDLLSPVFRIEIAGWYHLLFFGVFIPFLVVRGRMRFVDETRPLPSRLRHFQSTAFTLVLFCGLSLWIGRLQWIDLFPRRVPSLWSILAGVGLLALFVAFMRPRWRRAVERKNRVVHLFMPDNATERAWWIAVSVLAGVGEEITWRGVQTVLLDSLIGNYALAVLVCAAMFGAAHYTQGWKSALIIAFFSLGFGGLVWLSGSLYVAMAVHVAYDIAAGLTYGKLGRELGYQPAVAKPPDDAQVAHGP
jgi:hypothetical protein